VIGPYRLERELGSGGMGVVWLAQRTDGMIRRPVALKLPHARGNAPASPPHGARAGILASLTHRTSRGCTTAGVTAAAALAWPSNT